MIEMCVVLAILGVMGLMCWVNYSNWTGQHRNRIDQISEKAIVASVREQAVLLGQAIRLKHADHEVIFYPDGRWEDHANDKP